MTTRDAFIQVTQRRTARVVISASASFALAAVPGQSPFVAQGEEVNRVRVVVALRGPSQVACITKSDREVAATTAEDLL